MHERVCRRLSRSYDVFECVIIGCVGYTRSHFLSIYISAQSACDLYICGVFDFLDRLVEPHLHHLSGLCHCTLQCVIESKGGKTTFMGNVQMS